MNVPNAASLTARRRALEAAALLAAALLFGGVCTLPQELAQKAAVSGAPPAWLLPFDDAYIFIRYAQQAARGHGWEWNEGEPSTGASSTLWTWMLVPAHWFFHGLPGWSGWSRWLGVASLWALGLAGVRTLRATGLAEPWPLAAGFSLVWAGPIGFGAVAGMESAANAALLVLACALWIEAARSAHPSPAPWRSVWFWALLTTALLPLARPENGVLTLAAALAVTFGKRISWFVPASPTIARPDASSWRSRLSIGFALLVPGAVLAACNLRATGFLTPSGGLLKSWLHLPFLPLAARVESYLALLRDALLPVYLGTRPYLLPPPVGLVATVTGAAVLVSVARHQALPGECAGEELPPRVALAPLAPLAVAWLVLVLLGPLSTHLLWQQMRHHHSGLALAWLLAWSGAGIGCQRLGSWWRSRFGNLAPRRWLLLAAPFILIATFPYWAGQSMREAARMYRGHARAAAWLAIHAHEQPLLVTDAGLLSIVHDGPIVDGLGLGSPDLTAAALNGPGALLESLARRRPLPAIAAIEPALLPIPFLGEPLLPMPSPAGEFTVLAWVRQDLLAAIAQSGPGLQFAYLPDERRHHLRWHPGPRLTYASLALLLPGPDARRLELAGCRPLFGALEIELPAGVGRLSLRATVVSPGPTGEVMAAIAAPGGTPGQPLVSGRLTVDRWSEIAVPWSIPGAGTLWLARRGSGVPCLEALRFSGGEPAPR